MSVPPKRAFRFVLPSSVGPEGRACVPKLEACLAKSLGRSVQVSVAADYKALGAQLLGDKCEAAWAPPYVCSRLEAMGAKVMARVVRNGAASYRAALVCRKSDAFNLSQLAGKRAAWIDKDSVGGYLLAVAFLRSQKLDPSKLFASQTFVGSYAQAVKSLMLERADVMSVFAPAGSETQTGLRDVAPDHEKELAVVAFTDESPNDGVALSMSLSSAEADILQQTLLQLHTSEEGKGLLQTLFHGESFEVAPRLSYRALYRVAASGL